MMLPKKPPHDTDAEEGILGTIAMEPTVYIPRGLQRGLKRESFHLPINQILWQGMLELYAESPQFDEIMLHDYLRSKDVWPWAVRYLPPSEGSQKKVAEAFGTLVNFNRITSRVEVALTGFFDNWLQIVHRKYLSREMLALAGNIMLRVADEEDPIGMIEDMETFILGSRTSDKTTLERANIVAPRAYQKLEDARLNGNQNYGLSWGLIDLDAMLRLSPGSLTILAARPAMGKSALAGKFVLINGLTGKKGLVFGLEMVNDEYAERLIAMRAHVNLRQYRDNINTGHQVHERVFAAQQEIANLPIWFEEASPIDIGRIRATARQQAMQYGLDYVVVDYLQLAEGSSEKKNQIREQEISEISRGLKSLAKELNIPVLALSQLNRNVETRKDPMPQLSDLRESGSLEQDADNVVFIAPSATDEHGKWIAGGKMNISVAKCRGGPVGSVRATFLKQYTLFENYAHEYN